MPPKSPPLKAPAPKAPLKVGPGTPRSKKREKPLPARKDSPRGAKEALSKPSATSNDALAHVREERVRGGGNLREALTSKEVSPNASPVTASMAEMTEDCSQEQPYRDVIHSLHPLLTSAPLNPKNNIMLMTDGYKFSHHKQYPVSWMPEHARPAIGATEPYRPPILIAPCDGQPGSKILKILPVPCFVEDPTRQFKVLPPPLRSRS